MSDLLAARMHRDGCPGAFIAAACKLWSEFWEVRRPRIAKPAVYAAATHYAASVLHPDERVTQSWVADLYGVSVSSVHRVFDELMQLLEPVLYDPRFFDTGESWAAAAHQDLDQVLQQPAAGWELELDPDVERRLLRLPQTDEVWDGGRRSLRAYVLKPHPFRPDVALYVDQETRLVLGQSVLMPDDPGEALLELLWETMLVPAVGRPRRPRQVRMADTGTAINLGNALDRLGIEVWNRPTPVVDEVFCYMEQALVEDRPAMSYLDSGRILGGQVAAFFRAAARLHRVNPWDRAGAEHLFSVDLNRYSYDQACVALQGGGEGEPGLLILRSLEDYRRFSGGAPRCQHKPAICSQVELLALTFRKGTELNQLQLKEVLQHGWEVDGVDSYPVLRRTDCENISVPLTPDDYLAAAACAEAVAGFVENTAAAETGDRERRPAVEVPLPDWHDEAAVRITAAS